MGLFGAPIGGILGKNIGGAVGGGLGGIFGKTGRKVGSELGSAVGGIGGGVLGAMLPFATGGAVPGKKGRPVKAMLHGGEYVLPANAKPTKAQKKIVAQNKAKAKAKKHAKM